MNRRTFIAGLGGLAANWSLASHAQPLRNDVLDLWRSGFPDRRAWKHIPSIVVISAEDDARLKAVHEAVIFWNAELEKLGTSFRLGRVRDVSGLLWVNDVDRPSHASSMFDLIQRIRRMDGDVIVALSKRDFNPFATGWLAPNKKLIGIPSEQTYAFKMPNRARNVMAHELGHVIGLDHNEVPAALMCGETPWCHFNFPKEGFIPLTNVEKAKLVEMYPPHWQEERRWKGDPPPEANAG